MTRIRHRILPCVLVLLLALGLAGCEIFGSGGSPEMSVTIGSTTVGDSYSHAFASTEVGSSTDVTFTVQNVGDGKNLSISGISVTGAHFNISTTIAGDIAPGEKKTFTVRYQPTATGAHSEKVTIANNDPNRNVFQFGVTGTATPVAPFLAPPSWIQGTWWQSGSTLANHNEFVFSSDNVVNTYVSSSVVLFSYNFKQQNADWYAAGSYNTGYYDAVVGSDYQIDVKSSGTITGTYAFAYGSASQFTLTITGTGGGGPYTFNKQ